MSELLISNGFTQLFPFVDTFRKHTSELSCIQVRTCHLLKKGEKVEDSTSGAIFIKVTKIQLPKSESKIFHKIENALAYANN